MVLMHNLTDHPEEKQASYLEPKHSQRHNVSELNVVRGYYYFNDLWVLHVTSLFWVVLVFELYCIVLYCSSNPPQAKAVHLFASALNLFLSMGFLTKWSDTYLLPCNNTTVRCTCMWIHSFSHSVRTRMISITSPFRLTHLRTKRFFRVLITVGCNAWLLHINGNTVNDQLHLSSIHIFGWLTWWIYQTVILVKITPVCLSVCLSASTTFGNTEKLII